MANAQRLRISYLIKRTELLVRTSLEAALVDLSVTAGQYAVLSLLPSMPEASSAQLARSVGVTPQTMAETIVAFEKNGLIQRERSSAHGRILMITLTTKGLELLKQCEARVTEAEQELFGQLSADELQRLRATLELVQRQDVAARP